jgi:4-hydroxy-3-polyprenylbenzoate decarboxylase
MKIIVAISGATGPIYGIRLLEVLRQLGVETHLIVSEWAEKTIAVETSCSLQQVKELASYVHAPSNQAAIVSSGSFRTDGMVIVPCSMKTLASISHGYADNLIARAADVVLKERRKLVLVPRETPLSEIHLENMLRLARMGAVVLPPMPAFYTKPETVDDIVLHTVARILDQLGLEHEVSKRWLH